MYLQVIAGCEYGTDAVSSKALVWSLYSGSKHTEISFQDVSMLSNLLDNMNSYGNSNNCIFPRVITASVNALTLDCKAYTLHLRYGTVDLTPTAKTYSFTVSMNDGKYPASQYSTSMISVVLTSKSKNSTYPYITNITPTGFTAYKSGTDTASYPYSYIAIHLG